MDLTGYLQFQSGLCSKMPLTAILSIFLHKPMAGPHCRSSFPCGVVPSHFVGFSLYRSTGKFKKSDRVCWTSQVLFGIVSKKEKLFCSCKTIHHEKVVYVSSHFWLWSYQTELMYPSNASHAQLKYCVAAITGRYQTHLTLFRNARTRNK